MAKYRSKSASCGLCKPQKKGLADKHKAKFRNILDNMFVEIVQSYDNRCTHKNCDCCNDTGIDKYGNICEYSLACLCPRCSPTSVTFHLQ